MTICGQNLASLVSLTIYVEVEGHVMDSTYTQDEVINLGPEKIF